MKTLLPEKQEILALQPKNIRWVLVWDHCPTPACCFPSARMFQLTPDKVTCLTDDLAGNWPLVWLSAAYFVFGGCRLAHECNSNGVCKTLGRIWMNEVGCSSSLSSPFVDLSFSAFDRRPAGDSSPSVQGLSPSGHSGISCPRCYYIDLLHLEYWGQCLP